MTVLSGHRIVVTGAARGLGRSIAERLAASGAKLVLADILDEEGQATARALDAEYHSVDLAQPSAIEAFARTITKGAAPIDGLVNNAAIATGIGGKRFDEIEIDVWDRVMSVNVRGTWLLTRHLAQALKVSGRGRVVNVASDTALWGAPRLLAYVASKGAVMAMTRSLARELGPDRIGITCVAPGILKTWSTEYVPEERHRLYEDGRAVPGPQSPEDITDAIAFLLSPGALTLTGQTLPLDNGFVFA